MPLTERVIKIETSIESQKEILLSLKEDLHLLTQIVTKTELLENEIKFINKRIEVLEESKSSVVKWVFGVVGTTIAGAFAVGIK